MADSNHHSIRMSVFKHKTFCFITGASRGYGQCVAQRFAARFPSGSFLLLAARDKKALAEIKSAILKARSDITVEIWCCDLATATYKQIDELLRNLVPDPSLYEQALIIHNAGSMGDITRQTIQQVDDNALDKYWRLNVTSMLLLNSAFWKTFPESSVDERLIIQITSICAKQPFKSCSLYCAGKAARDMLMCTLAEESPSIRVLNYAPGPLDTEMQKYVRETCGDSDIRNMFIEMKSGDRLLTPDQSVDRLISLLDKNSFESGDHIDYYDIVMHESVSLSHDIELE